MKTLIKQNKRALSFAILFGCLALNTSWSQNSLFLTGFQSFEASSNNDLEGAHSVPLGYSLSSGSTFKTVYKLSVKENANDPNSYTVNFGDPITQLRTAYGVDDTITQADYCSTCSKEIQLDGITNIAQLNKAFRDAIRVTEGHNNIKNEDANLIKDLDQCISKLSSEAELSDSQLVYTSDESRREESNALHIVPLEGNEKLTCQMKRYGKLYTNQDARKKFAENIYPSIKDQLNEASLSDIGDVTADELDGLMTEMEESMKKTFALIDEALGLNYLNHDQKKKLRRLKKAAKANLSRDKKSVVKFKKAEKNRIALEERTNKYLEDQDTIRTNYNSRLDQIVQDGGVTQNSRTFLLKQQLNNEMRTLGTSY